MKELVKFIAQSLVDNPEQVQVNEIEGEQTSVIELRVAKEDLGKVIGKQGRTARAIRTGPPSIPPGRISAPITSMPSGTTTSERASSPAERRWRWISPRQAPHS